MGDKVAYYYNKYCGKCHFCKNGQEHLCTGVSFNMSSMCEYIIVSKDQVWKLPKDVDLLKGALAEPISFCLHTVDLGNVKSGDTAVISSGGAIGLMTLVLAKRAGASKLTVIEPVAEKRQMALELDLDIFTRCVFPKEQFEEAFKAQSESKNAKVIIKLDDSL